MKRILVIVAILSAVFTFSVTAQEASMMFSDSLGRYQISVPAGWQSVGTGEMGEFTNADGSVSVATLVVAADDVQAGIMAGLGQTAPDFNGAMVQSSEIPLPGGNAWTQHIYADASGNLIAALGRTIGAETFLIIVNAPQAALAAESAAINEILFSFTPAGEVSLLGQSPQYVSAENFTETEVVVGSSPYALPGTLTMPIGEGPFPAVVIVHGSGPNDRDGTLAVNRPYRDIAQGLASQGIAVLRYDKRTFVYRNPVAGFTVDHEITDDAVAAVELLRQTAGVDAERIYVLGHSQGAMFAPRIAERDGMLAGIIMMAGTPHPFDQVLNTQIDYLRSLDPNADVGGLDMLVQVLDSIRDGADPVEAFGGDESQSAYWTSVLEYTPGETAQRLDLPMLVLQGARDYQTTLADFALWGDLLGERENVSLIAYPTLNHIFMALGDLDRLAMASDYNEPGFVDGQVIEDIAGWIRGQSSS